MYKSRVFLNDEGLIKYNSHVIWGVGERGHWHNKLNKYYGSCRSILHIWLWYNSWSRSWEKILRRIQNSFFKIKKIFPKLPPHFAVNHFREMLDPPITFNTRQQLAIFFLEVRTLRKTCILPGSWPIYL